MISGVAVPSRVDMKGFEESMLDIYLEELCVVVTTEKEPRSSSGAVKRDHPTQETI